MKKLLGNRGTVAVLLLALAGALAIESTHSRADRVLPDAALYFLEDVRLPQKGERALLFSPHPDDETIAAGGYVIQAVRNGAEVKIVLVTDGNKHGLMNRRYHEFTRATSLLGVPQSHLLFLNHPDGLLDREDPLLLRKEFEAIMRSYDPLFIIYPHPSDHHPDHAVVGRTVQSIITSSFPQAISYQYLVHHERFPYPKRLREDAPLLPPASMVHFDNEWKRLMLPKQVEDRKLEAVLEYTSQLRVPLLRSLLLGLVRRNELFAVPRGQNV